MKLCQACMREPKGVEGHPDLRLDLFRDSDAEKMSSVFICEACRAIWRRAFLTGGEFQWQRFDASD